MLDVNRAAGLMVGVDLGVSSVFGIPNAVDIRGVLIDVDYNIAFPVNIDGDPAKVKRFQVLTGMTSSALEHTLFEFITGVEAVSTVKALQIANTQGIQVHQIDAANITSKLPLIQVSNEVKAEVQDAVNAGKVVIISEGKVQINNWNGVGYAILDPSNGAGAYQISGGLSGGCLSFITQGLQQEISAGKMDINKATELIVLNMKKIWFFMPVVDQVVSAFGWRKILDKGVVKEVWHGGVDFGSPIGTNVIAIAKGRVVKAWTSPSYGNVVYIDHGAGVQTRYAHGSKLLVKVGDDVQIGQSIIVSGNTGSVYPQPSPKNPDAGAHLHFEIRLLVPEGSIDGGSQVDPSAFAPQLYI